MALIRSFGVAITTYYVQVLIMAFSIKLIDIPAKFIYEEYGFMKYVFIGVSILMMAISYTTERIEELLEAIQNVKEDD
ncbi:hypothetical protein OF387_16990 [Lentilactobacillus hilgardii]|nr:hypothetical protein [Lentilactobacillus hilgardii]MCV3742933.1 hypothetical protein [Lentilactobacillus hilgardii]